MDEQNRWRALEDVGVPESVIAYIREQNPSGNAYGMHQLLTFVLIIAGFAVGVVLWGPVEALAVRNAIAHANAVGGLMYDVNFGFAGLLAIFAWIMAAGLIANLSIVGPRRRLSYFVSTLGASYRSIARFSVKMGLRKVTHLSGDPDAYIEAWVKRGNGSLAIATLIVSTLAGYALAREVNTHTVYTADAYTRSPFFPWAPSAPRPWRTAELVDLGCNHVTGRNASDYLVYRVEFPGGERVSLESATPLPDVDWLTVAEPIDALIREGGATFQRWKWLSRDPLHPACLAVMQQNFGADYPRIERLLRIGELPNT